MVSYYYNIQYTITILLELLLRYIKWLLTRIQHILNYIKVIILASTNSSSCNNNGDTGTILVLDSGITVRVGKKLTEGGFSYIYEATMIDDNENNNDTSVSTSIPKGSTDNSTATATLTSTQKYVLKRIQCQDTESVEQCRIESSIHRSYNSHPNLMPLLGTTIVSIGNSTTTAFSNSKNRTNSNKNMNTNTENVYYFMLFPFIPFSLRDEMNRRIPSIVSLSSNNNNVDNNSNRHQQHRNSITNSNNNNSNNCPWTSEIELLYIFYQICCSVQVLHDHQYTHRDIKLENILLLPQQEISSLQSKSTSHSQSSSTNFIPILMDFGSAGSITVPLSSRKHILTIIDTASSQTTISYRPPELFDGGLRIPSSPLSLPISLNSNNTITSESATPTKSTFTSSSSIVFDYRVVDVYMLGCVLHGLMYGLSPNECEFRRTDGTIQVCVPTHLSVLRGISKPPKHTITSTWYSNDLYTLLLEPMLHQDRYQRILLSNAINNIEQLIVARGGIIPR